jgi:hypothetical protein
MINPTSTQSVFAHEASTFLTLSQWAKSHSKFELEYRESARPTEITRAIAKSHSNLSKESARPRSLELLPLEN